MLNYIEQMLVIIWGQDFINTYSWSQALLEIHLFAFAILIVILTYKLWYYLLIGWWRK